jgi:protein SCO1/2/putative membrane protein
LKRIAMNPARSYRWGLWIVLGVVFVSALLVARFAPLTPPARAAQDLGVQGETIGAFRLVERSGRMVTEADLAGRVCLFSFIFTRCQLSCPRITSVMKMLQERLSGTTVLLVSISVDPEHDTPSVLETYARSYGADPERWWFLTGPRSSIYDLIQQRFKLSVVPKPSPDPEGRTEAIAHSERIALVDHGRIVGLFDSTETTALDALVGQARRRATPGWVRALPSLNASLNALCACLLILGWLQIRGRNAASPSRLLTQPQVRRHVACMVLAVATSAAFLVSYLAYHAQAGSMPFRGQGTIRLVYFSLLLSHTVLATFGVIPLVLMTLWRAWRRDFLRHRSIAALTFPIWLYVSVTGVLIYWMLYQMPLGPSLGV